MEESHWDHVSIALEKLNEHQLVVNFKKCEFRKQILSYLGHEILSEGVSVEANKVQAMQD